MKKVWWSGILVAIFALNTQLLWLYELRVHIGWAGEGWMQVNQWSLYGIVALVVASFLAPLVIVRQLKGLVVLKATIELYLTTLVAFFIIRIILLSVYNSVYGYLHFGGLMLILGVVGLLTAYSYRNISKRRLLKELPRQLVGWVVTAFLGSILLSWLTILLFDGWYWQDLWYNLVKSGLLFFWLAILLGVVSLITARHQWPGQNRRNPAILDDIAELQKPED